MDYFSELLESYSKLKKRTFKLTYITEADEKKGEDLRKYIDQAKQAFDAALTGEDQIEVCQEQNSTIENRNTSEIGQPSITI